MYGLDPNPNPTPTLTSNYDSADAELAVGRGAAREGLAVPLVSGVLDSSALPPLKKPL